MSWSTLTPVKFSPAFTLPDILNLDRKFLHHRELFNILKVTSQSTLRLPEVCIKCYKIEFIWPYMAVNEIHRLPYANSLVDDTISSIFLHRHKAKTYKLYKHDLQ